MDALPDSLKLRILGLLSSLNDLVACRKVNRKLKMITDDLLGTIEHIDVHVLNEGTEEPSDSDSLSVMVKKDLRKYVAYIDTESKRKPTQMTLLLNFLKQLSPRFFSIHAPEVDVIWIDLEPFAQGMIYFCLREIKTGRQIDAEFLHKHFTNLIAYNLRSEGGHRIDPLEAFEKYSHHRPQRFINCPVYLTAQHVDRFPKIVTPSTRALLIEGKVNILKKLSACALDSIQLLMIYCCWPSIECGIQLQGLLYFTLHCATVDTNQLANFLAASSRLKFISVAGQVEGSNDIFSPLRPHLRSWRDLTDVSFGPDTPDGRSQGRIDTRRKPLSLTSIALMDQWHSLSLWSVFPIIFRNSPVASDRLRKLSLDGPIPDQFDFVFPNLLSFTFKFSARKQKLAWLIRCLKSSNRLERFTLEPTDDSRSGIVRQVDCECVIEFIQFFEKTDSLKTVLFCPCEVYNPPSKAMCTLDLRSRNRHPIYFDWELYNYPMQVIVPSHVNEIRLAGREKYTNFRFKQINDAGWSKRRSVFRITAGLNEFSFDQIGEETRIQCTAEGGRSNELKFQIEKALQQQRH